MSRTTVYNTANALRCVSEAVTFYDGILGELGFVQGVDEIAILLPSASAATEFVTQMVREDGVMLFNTASDHVHTSPLKTCYNVDYNFLTVPMATGRPLRIEVMALTSGVSPLHYAALHEMHYDGSALSLIHASFKVDDEDDYATAVHRLRERGWEAAQRCESTYGRFSYWTPLDDSGFGDMPDECPPYLKPRVNLRDAAQPHS